MKSFLHQEISNLEARTMSCFASPEEWDKVQSAILALFDRLRELGARGNHIVREWVKELRHELNILWEDLQMWRKDEEVCWDEFWSRIRRIKKQIESLEKVV